MKLTSQDIDTIAGLVKLELSDAEKNTLAGHISRLLEDFERLNDLDTTGVEATSHALPITNVWRDDLARPSLPTHEVTANGPDVAEGCFVVPRVVDV